VFERFTDQARRVVVHAQEEARLLKHDYIGTEHILLGLIREDGDVAAGVLEALDIGLDAVREQVEAIIGPGKKEPRGHIPFTPRAKKVLEISLRESISLGNDYIGTEHILLGLMREGDGVACQVLTALGASHDEVRALVIERITTPERPARLRQLDERVTALRAELETAIDRGEFERARELRDQERRVRAERDMSEQDSGISEAPVGSVFEELAAAREKLSAAQAELTRLALLLREHGINLGEPTTEEKEPPGNAAASEA
jgi:ATP-dependent Clp protease ATP-binding subunit ClpA